MIIDDKHAARAFLLDRPLAAPVRVFVKTGYLPNKVERNNTPP
jgi:hypothetical protein